MKDKLFIFGDYLRTSDHEAIANTFTIPDSRYFTPTATPLPGCTDPAGCIDLSGAMNGTNGQIYDPTSYTDGKVHDGSKGDPRPAFPNNQLPYSLVKFRAGGDADAAERGGRQVRHAYDQASQQSRQQLHDQSAVQKNQGQLRYQVGLFSHGEESFQRTLQLSARHHLSGAGIWGFPGGPAGGGFEANGNQKSYSTGVNYDRVFSPTFLTEVRVGVAHLGNSAQPNDYGSNDATTIGIPGVNIDGQPFTSGQVAVTINGGFSNPLVGYSASVPWIRAESNIDIVNNWTKIVGNHTFKWGADVRRVHDDLLQDQTFSPRGAYTFSDSQTSSSQAAGTAISNFVASFLLQQPSQVGRDLNTFFPRYRQWWMFAFASDKWQATPKLTLDLGVRWDFYPPATPAARRIFQLRSVNNQLVLAGLGSNPYNLGMKTQYRYFAPRTGFAYRARQIRSSVADSASAIRLFLIIPTPITILFAPTIAISLGEVPPLRRQFWATGHGGDVQRRISGAGAGKHPIQRNHRAADDTVFPARQATDRAGVHLCPAELQEPLRKLVERGGAAGASL